MSTCLIVTHPGDARLLPIAQAFSCGDPVTMWYVQQRRDTDEVAEISLHESTDDPVLLNIRQALGGASIEPPLLPTNELAGDELAGDQPAAACVRSNAPTPEDSDSQLRRPSGAHPRLFRIRGENPVAAVVAEISRQSVTLLVLPRHETSRKTSDEPFERLLFSRCPCDTLYVSWNGDVPARCQNLLIATRGNQNANTALTRAAATVETSGGQVTALYVQPAVDEVAREVGVRRLTMIARRAGVLESEHVQLRVEVADSLQAGIEQALNTPCDLLLFGASQGREAQRIMSGNAPSVRSSTKASMAVGVMRAAIPMSGRIRQRLDGLLQKSVPQLNRDQRVALVERVAASSKWNFDFTALMCLSTLIASLGLLQNSTAVVIGAMLIAPLMTPLVAVGLAIVQGNQLLLRTAQWTVLQGFAVAFVIAFLVAATAERIIAPGDWPSAEMWTRGSPGILDLFVAFVSGLAAAYAIGRPHLVSALPGVAIAAALVPPVATSGMAFALGEYRLGRGALMLFLTNIVAIVLATCVSLWSVGVRDAHKHGTRQRWSRRIAVMLCLLAVSLAIYESRPRLPTDLIAEMMQTVEARSDCQWGAVRIDQSSRDREVVVTIESKSADLPGLRSKLEALTREYFDSNTSVSLEIKLFQRSG